MNFPRKAATRYRAKSLCHGSNGLFFYQFMVLLECLICALKETLEWFGNRIYFHIRWAFQQTHERHYIFNRQITLSSGNCWCCYGEIEFSSLDKHWAFSRNFEVNCVHVRAASTQLSLSASQCHRFKFDIRQ